MRILFLDQFSELGGAQRCLLDLMPAILNRGWKPRVAIPGPGALKDKLSALGVATEDIRLGPYHSGYKTIADAGQMAVEARRIANTLNWNADVVYVNGPRLLPSVGLARPECPVIFHAHSHLAKRYAARLAGWAIRRTYATVIANCESVADALRKYAAVQIIYNGVEDLGQRATLQRQPRIGVIGRIAPEKGQLEFVRAARLLPEFQFVIYGASLFSDPAYERQVRKESAGLPIEFAGWRDNVGDAVADLDLLVVPSSGMEATTRVILEAFSAGKPVLAAAAGGIPEVVQDGVNGFLASSNAPEALAEGIRRALQSSSNAVGSSARKSWEQRFRITRYQDDICRLLASKVQNSAAPTNTPTAAATSVAG